MRLLAVLLKTKYVSRNGEGEDDVEYVRMSGCQDCWDVPQGFFSGVDPAEDGLKEASGVGSKRGEKARKRGR